MFNNEDIKSQLSRIDALFISEKFFSMMTKQSCDCDEIIIQNNDNYIKLTSKLLGEEDSFIDFEKTNFEEAQKYPYEINFEKVDFVFDKTISLESGEIDGIRFKGNDVFLFVFASEYNLVLTMSKYDLFEEIHMELPQKEATLNILKRNHS
ncbi:MAG: hypothetical protein J6Q70_04620 [Clostridia bacterium]|nr:hypothetical protein [Clostridia bacterium]